MRIRRGDERKPEERRSVYEDRPGPEPEEEEHWEEIGELGGPLDFRRAGGWRPLSEFLWRRR
jgi:hypothetical protein